MTWYYLFRVADGALLSGGTVLGENVLNDATLDFISKPGRVDERFNQWDTTLRDFVPRPQPQRRILSRLEFRRRYTLAELSTLNALRLDQTVPAAIRGQLETLHQYVSDATNINLDDPDTVTGVALSLQVLGTLGGMTHLDTQPERDVRAAEILASAPAED